MKIPIIRPAQMSDLEVLIKCSADAGCGITSLPHNRTLLEKKLYACEQSFRENLITPSHETYLFCLEYEDQVIGTAGIVSRIGMTEPFFAYHLLYEHHFCPYLNIDEQVPVLHFIRARKKPTELGTLFLSKPFRKKGFSKLLSFSRFLFIAAFRNRFASTVVAELRGINDGNNSPFWNAIGRPFFKVDFSRADALRTEHFGCIEEVFPKHPIYVPLLAKEAQAVIGMAHPDTIPAQKLLEQQGLKMSHYVDLMDAGPHLYAHTDSIKAIAESHEAIVCELSTDIPQNSSALIANTRLDFRATVAPFIMRPEGIVIHPDVAVALRILRGETIRYFPVS